MEEIMNKEFETEEVYAVEPVEEAYDDRETLDSGSNFNGLLIRGAIAGAIALGALAYSKRDNIKGWLNKRRIKKLEKDGYIVCPSSEEYVENAAAEILETDNSVIQIVKK